MHDVETAMLHYLKISTEICVMLRKLQYQVWTNGLWNGRFCSRKDVDTQSIFCIGSVTKSFTATCFTLPYSTYES